MSKKRSTTDIKPNSLLVRGQSQTPSSLSLCCRGLLTAASRKVHIYPPPRSSCHSSSLVFDSPSTPTTCFLFSASCRIDTRLQLPTHPDQDLPLLLPQHHRRPSRRIRTDISPAADAELAAVADETRPGSAKLAGAIIVGSAGQIRVADFCLEGDGVAIGVVAAPAVIAGGADGWEGLADSWVGACAVA